MAAQTILDTGSAGFIGSHVAQKLLDRGDRVVGVDSNVTGFLHVLEGCRRHGIEHLVFASTSSVYGANTAMPFSENQCTTIRYRCMRQPRMPTAWCARWTARPARLRTGAATGPIQPAAVSLPIASTTSATSSRWN